MSRPAAQGERGEQGIPGAQGIPGLDGIPGAQGIPGLAGLLALRLLKVEPRYSLPIGKERYQLDIQVRVR